MSRSKRKTPIFGTSLNRNSNKEFKKQEHQRERREVHMLLHVGKYEDLPHHKKYGNEWNSPRDGKIYWSKWEAMFGGVYSWFWVIRHPGGYEGYIKSRLKGQEKCMRK